MHDVVKEAHRYHDFDRFGGYDQYKKILEGSIEVNKLNKHSAIGWKDDDTE